MVSCDTGNVEGSESGPKETKENRKTTMTKLQRDRKNFYAAIAARLGAGVPAEQIGSVDYGSPLAGPGSYFRERVTAADISIASRGNRCSACGHTDCAIHHGTPPDLTPRRGVLEALED